MTAAVIDSPRLLRLTPCPRCADRRRTLVDTDSGLRGHCLGCGRLLAAPLATEALDASDAAAPTRRLRDTARIA